MKQHRLALAAIAALATGLALVGGAPATSAATTAAATSPRDAAIQHARANVKARGAALGFVTGQALVVRDVIIDSNGMEHVRFDRTYRGLPVLGGDLVVHSAKGGAFRGADRASAAMIKLSTTRPAVGAPAAANLAVAAGTARNVSTATPALAVDATGTPRLVWEVVVAGERADQTPAELHVIVDALSGSIVRQWDGVPNVEGTGEGFFNGPVGLSTQAISGGFRLTDLTRGGQFTCDMRNRTRNCYYLDDADNRWGDGTLGSRQTTAVDAQYGAAETWDYFSEVHGRNGIRNDGKGAYSRVHYGKNYNNAFWSDSCFCMTYGDGDGKTYNPFDSLDVAGHEMAHGVTSQTARLVYSGESGGLNEATSDIFGAMVEYFAGNARDAGDYKIGEKLYKVNSGESKALRYMWHPSLDGVSEDCWYSGIGSVNVHYSSGPANHFFYLLAEGSAAVPTSPICAGTGVASVPSIGKDAAAKIWYRALTVYMTSSTDYAGARDATLQAAADLYGGVASPTYNAVSTAWLAVNVR